MAFDTAGLQASRRQEEGRRTRVSLRVQFRQCAGPCLPQNGFKRRAKGAIRAGAIRSMQAFTGEEAGPHLAGVIYAASWREQVAAQPALLLTGRQQGSNVALHV